MLTAVAQELCDLLSDLGSGDYSSSSVSVTELEIDLHRARENIDRMTKDLEEKNEELKRRSETIMELTSRVRRIDFFFLDDIEIIVESLKL